MEERAAEREPLQHPAGERAGTLVARVPEAVPLEEHADPLAALADAVEAAVEVEVLERRQIAVHERLVAEVAEPAAVEVDLEATAARGREPRDEPQQRGLAGAVRPRDDQERAARDVEVDRTERPRCARTASRPRAQ